MTSIFLPSKEKDVCFCVFRPKLKHIIWSNHSDTTSPQNKVEEGKWDPLFEGNQGW